MRCGRPGFPPTSSAPSRAATACGCSVSVERFASNVVAGYDLLPDLSLADRRQEARVEYHRGGQPARQLISAGHDVDVLFEAGRLDVTHAALAHAGRGDEVERPVEAHALDRRIEIGRAHV